MKSMSISQLSGPSRPLPSQGFNSHVPNIFGSDEHCSLTVEHGLLSTPLVVKINQIIHGLGTLNDLLLFPCCRFGTV
jgi:hypothetical protein